MKILHINISDAIGGASRAVYRLHRALLDEGVTSIMLVQYKNTDDYTIIDMADNRIEKGFNRLRPLIDQIPVKLYKNRIGTLFSPAWFGSNKVLKKIQEIDPDIVHLHWITGGMMKIEDIAKIKKPMVWSLHDNWAFTGGCHIKWECENYKNICGACPILRSTREKDLSTWIWIRKNKIFSKVNNLIINGISKWIVKLSKESSLLKNKKHINLPNLINTDVYKPFDKEKSRKLWNLPREKKIILFGALNPINDINKGFKQLEKALKQLKDNNIELVVFGSYRPKNPPNFGFKTYYIGRLYDDISLVTLYNAVDVVVIPSLQENLSNTIMESLSCGTPVVAFNVGGNSEMIEHKKNGYLAEPFDSKDLANGIEWILNLDENEYNKLCKNARQKILKEFDSKVVVRKYIEFYREILKSKEK